MVDVDSRSRRPFRKEYEKSWLQISEDVTATIWNSFQSNLRSLWASGDYEMKYWWWEVREVWDLTTCKRAPDQSEVTQIHITRPQPRLVRLWLCRSRRETVRLLTSLSSSSPRLCSLWSQSTVKTKSRDISRKLFSLLPVLPRCFN